MTNSTAAQKIPNGITARAEYCARLIRIAGAEAKRGFAVQSSQEAKMKGPQDYLTETDLAVEALIKSHLSRQFPADGVLGEETGGDVAGDYWVIDPIDGTANFARGIAHYAIVIAFVSNGVTEIGAIYNVELDELYFALNGAGATRNGKRLSVAKTQTMDRASVELGWSTRLSNQSYVDMVSATLDRGANVRRASSGALGLAFVADGRSDGYAELHMNAWDCLAGLLLVKEADGIVAGTSTQSDLAAGGSVLAATPAIAEQFSAATTIPILSRSV